MPNTYLNAKFKEKDQVKALGAQFDSERRAWFVPEGLDLAPFRAWMPGAEASAGSLLAQAATEGLPARQGEQSTAVAVARRGVSLSHLMLGVTQAVARAYATGVWTTVEVVKVDARNGNVYLELAERVDGRVVAQARGTIWANEARRIVPGFERATGVVLGGGIKLLVRAKPTAHAIYGLSVAIEEIDPDYTLGDLEAKKREIRSRLQREGLFGENKKLPQPWDYTSVVVVAPQGAAGLGDFQAESERLARYGVCAFVYAHSRFQGEGAAAEIRATLLRTMDEFVRWNGHLPDAVAVIRGGGAVNDLAWLNDYDLARTICEMEVPVLTGIGHERDGTVLDEVAHTKFDTPSKVIAGIEQLIVRRAQEAKASFDEVVQLAGRTLQSTTRAVDGMNAAVGTGAIRHIASARQRTDEMVGAVRLGAMQVVRRAADTTKEQMFGIRAGAAEAVGDARRLVPALLSEITGSSARSVVTAKATASEKFGFIVERARSDATRSEEAASRGMSDISEGARRALSEAKDRSEAMMREIAGQGPSKTLGRGFAVVRHEGGQTVTSAMHANEGARIEIEFRDGVVVALTQGLTAESKEK